MFDFVYRKKRVVQVILALITLPFAFFGVDYYFRSAGSVSEIAKVGGDRITQAEYAETIREQQDRMRQSMGANFDPTVFDSPEVRYSVLEQIISQRLLESQARRDSFRVSDAQLAQFIGSLPAFQTPEEVKIEYLSLNPEAVSGQIAVDLAEVRKVYNDNLKQYGKAEERQASHILIAVKPDASEEQKTAAKKKAED